MVLFLLRHGDALDGPTLHDHERPLSNFGKQQAATAARFLHTLHPPLDIIISSPLLRAQQTADAVQEKFPDVSRSVSEYLSPMSNPLQLFRELTGSPWQAVLLTGHEPFMSAAISHLIAGYEQAKVEIRKSTLACVHSERPLDRGSGILRWIVPFELMSLRK